MNFYYVGLFHNKTCWWIWINCAANALLLSPFYLFFFLLLLQVLFLHVQHSITSSDIVSQDTPTRLYIQERCHLCCQILQRNLEVSLTEVRDTLWNYFTLQLLDCNILNLRRVILLLGWYDYDTFIRFAHKLMWQLIQTVLTIVLVPSPTGFVCISEQKW